ncbi:uncharacterized protein V2V93DRAFT_372374 [Kockiozyma suomiensis]|uniref:uncharacterized protein n=1 Tax=Kockiozyma suomiensis TaxID=1337062 RepID=UPI0033433542
MLRSRLRVQLRLIIPSHEQRFQFSNSAYLNSAYWQQRGNQSKIPRHQKEKQQQQQYKQQRQNRDNNFEKYKSKFEREEGYHLRNRRQENAEEDSDFKFARDGGRQQLFKAGGNKSRSHSEYRDRNQRRDTAKKSETDDEEPEFKNYHRPDRGRIMMSPEDVYLESKVQEISAKVFSTAQSFRKRAPLQENLLDADNDISDTEIEPDRKSSTSSAKALSKTSRNSYKGRAHDRNGKYITDPYLIAEYIKKALAQGRTDDALENARRGAENATVGWNYIIRRVMHEGKVNAAISYFNEMRRRGAVPNGFTFTALFEGLADNVASTPTALEKTKRILAYAVRSGKCKLEPILLTSALNVARQAGDINAMYEILDVTQDLISPDGVTYSMILSIYSNAARTDKALADEVREIWAEAVRHAERSRTKPVKRVVMSGKLILNAARALLKSTNLEDIYLVYRILTSAFSLPLYFSPDQVFAIKDPDSIEEDVIKSYLYTLPSSEEMDMHGIPLLLETCDRLRQRDAFLKYHEYFKTRTIMGSALHLKYTERMDEKGLPALEFDERQGANEDLVPRVTRADRRLQQRMAARLRDDDDD